MRFLRTISTKRLVALAATVVALFAAVAVAAVAASGGDGATPPPKPLADAIHDSLAGPDVAGVTARVTFTNKLFPSGALLGSAGPVLMSGGSGRLWMTNDGRGRIELQSDAGDAQIVWRPGAISVYDASSNTVYRATLPASTQADGSSSHAPPTVAQIADAITRIGTDVAVGAAVPTNVGGMPAYGVSLSPKHDGGLLGSVEVAWDAARAVPLRAAVYAQGASSPVLELTTTDIAYDAVPSSDVAVAPPANAKVMDLGELGGGGGRQTGSGAVTGLDAVRAAAGFPVTAPDTLVGLPRRDVRLVGAGDGKAAAVTYGQGLGAIVVVERASSSASGGGQGALDSLPTVSLDGVTAHELATQLGTILTWQGGGVTTVLAGSVPAAAAEAAARELR